MKLKKFGDVVPGTRFRYDNSVYVKTRLNMAMGADRKSIIFPSEAEVQVLEQDTQPGEKTRPKGQ
jgi:hypothetical protein